MKGTTSRKAARGGRCLLAGLLRCARCGHMLHVVYGRGDYARYECREANRAEAAPRCIALVRGALRRRSARRSWRWCKEAPSPRRWKRAISRSSTSTSSTGHWLWSWSKPSTRPPGRPTLRSRGPRQPSGGGGARSAMERGAAAGGRGRRPTESARHARRSHDARPSIARRSKSLATDLPRVWDAPSSDMRVKQRIARLLIHEIIANTDEDTREIVLVIHWVGGRHSEVRMPRPKAGEHRHRAGHGCRRGRAAHGGRMARSRHRRQPQPTAPAHRKRQHLDGLARLLAA